MALNSSEEQIIAYRRERVAYYRLRGGTVREIVQHLAEEELVNLRTKRPFGLGTIQADLTALEKEWQESARSSTATRKGRVEAELNEVRREAWARGDIATILKAMRFEADLFSISGHVPAADITPQPSSPPPADDSNRSVEPETAGGISNSDLEKTLQIATPEQRSQLLSAAQALDAAQRELFRLIEQLRVEQNQAISNDSQGATS